MFKKILVANRGEIAVRVMRTCKEMGIPTVGLYQSADRGSLHVRLADEVEPLNSLDGFWDRQAILEIARRRGADAIHPGYGFLSEREDFIEMCEQAGIAFIGPPAEVMRAARQKVDALQRAREAGFPTTEFSAETFVSFRNEALREEADRLGYPLVVKSCRGGRGRGERLVWSASRLEQAVQRAQAEALVVYGDRRVYLEKAILPAHQIGVQVLADRFGNLVHLGEREGSLLYGNQKVIEEAPAPCLCQEQRAKLWRMALALVRLFNFQGVGTVEFLLDSQGEPYFSEIKARIQVEHPITEMISGVDLVREQIRLAAGEPLDLMQEDIRLSGWAMQCRVRAEDPWRQFLPSPGHLQQVRLPGGPGVRVDTYLFSGCEIPGEYDPLIAKVIAWGPDRPTSLARLQRSLQEIQLIGTPTNLPLLQRILEQPSFVQGSYTTEWVHSPGELHLVGVQQSIGEGGIYPSTLPRDLAVAAAVVFMRRSQFFQPSQPARLRSGWHRDSRRLPE